MDQAVRYPAAELEGFTAAILRVVGLPSDDALQVARLMISADLRGADGHGVFRLPQYVRRIRAGGPRAKGRRAASRTQWTALCELVKARAGWRCQACALRTRLDVHHVVKRAQSQGVEHRQRGVIFALGAQRRSRNRSINST